MNSVDIEKLLDLQEKRLTALLALLNSELAILKERDLNALTAKAAEKEAILNDINQCDLSIKQKISVDELKNNHAFADKIQTIAQLLAECKKQNEVNGQIINNSQIAINRFKGMLQKSVENNSMTYDAKGKTQINLNSIGVKA